MNTRKPHRSSAATMRYTDYDVTDDSGWIGSDEFERYTTTLRKALALAATDERGATIAELHRTMGGAAQPRRTMDVLESLIADRAIRQVSFVTPIRFVIYR